MNKRPSLAYNHHNPLIFNWLERLSTEKAFKCQTPIISHLIFPLTEFYYLCATIREKITFCFVKASFSQRKWAEHFELRYDTLITCSVFMGALLWVFTNCVFLCVCVCIITCVCVCVCVCVYIYSTGELISPDLALQAFIAPAVPSAASMYLMELV